MKKLSILLLSFLSVACVTTYNPMYNFHEIRVANLSGATITDVNLRVTGSDKTLNCDVVAKNAQCQAYFGKRRYPKQGIELSWTDGDGSKKSQQSNPAIAAYFGTAASLILLLDINEEGSVETYFKQDANFAD
jgi:hypothetical protein